MNFIHNDILRRNLFNKLELKKLYYKFILYQKKDFLDSKNKIQKKLIKLSKNASKVRIKNRCIITGRSRAVYKDFRLSRFIFRELALNGNLPGVKKASW
jgi:ribosomal protein S14